MKILLTGAAGFAGAHIAEHLIQNTDWTVVCLDRLSYAGSLERLSHLPRNRIEFVYHDFRSPFPSPVLHKLGGIKYVIHNGGETHVENSLTNPAVFFESNVLGTMNVMEACLSLDAEHVIYVSTDEVHGPAPEHVSFTENAPMRPSNPYSASKVGGEAVAFSWWRSFKLPVTITRTMNLFGERQHPEKFVPMTISKLERGEKLTIHGSKAGQVGSRKWLHARNQADALLFILGLGSNALGETYHIAGKERTNLEIARFISEVMAIEMEHEILDFHSTRPGHDLRYSLDDTKLRSLGWKPPVEFEESLGRTVAWTLDHPEWISGAKNAVVSERR